MSSIPKELLYEKSHEWIRIEGNTATVGITDHAQHELTDIVFVELPKTGRSVKRGEAVVTVESVKSASDVYSPVAGTIAETNPALGDNPELVNQDPYGKGWLFKVSLAAAPNAADYLSTDAYAKEIGEA